MPDTMRDPLGAIQSTFHIEPLTLPTLPQIVMSEVPQTTRDLVIFCHERSSEFTEVEGSEAKSVRKRVWGEIRDFRQAQGSRGFTSWSHPE